VVLAALAAFASMILPPLLLGAIFVPIPFGRNEEKSGEINRNAEKMI